MREKMLKTMDFIIESDREYVTDIDYEVDTKIVFRLYPKKCRVHGFDDIAPNTWTEVYKVYFYFDIIKVYSDGKKYNKEKILYKENFDECSAINDLAYYLGEIIDGKNKVDRYFLMSMSNATDYELEENKNFDGAIWWTITMFNHGGHQGFKFYMYRDKLKEFREFLDKFLDYMIKHSEGI